MAAYVRYVRTISRIEYRVSAPTNATELDKAITGAVRERKTGLPMATISDDAVQIRVEDDVIVIWWEVEES